MKIKSLPITEISLKLGMISFSTPKKNLDVYRFIKSITPSQQYFDLERQKLLQKYGKEVEGDPGRYRIDGPEKVKAFNEDIEKIGELDIINEVYCPDLSEEDFEDENCCYPSEKTLWMSGRDIDYVLQFISEAKKERTNQNPAATP